ncbi:hypothetical protein V8B55DRAFT_1065281 [Mucor lusitanicus]
MAADGNKMYTHVCITSEYMTSQTCMFAFLDWHTPLLDKNRETRLLPESSWCIVCLNPDCVLQQFGCNVFARDKLSALAIGLSGVNQLLFQAAFKKIW